MVQLYIQDPVASISRPVKELEKLQKSNASTRGEERDKHRDNNKRSDVL